MGTEKRARQKEQHRTRREQATRDAARQARTRRVITIVGAVAVVAAILFGISFLNDEDDDSAAHGDDTSSEETTTTEPEFPPITGAGPGSALTGETPCPALDGSSPRTTVFENPPPMCIDPTRSYTATFTTSAGEFTTELNAADAPETVNNFVVLSRYHYYDGIPFHRIVPDFVIQAGDPDPNPTGIGGPGYTIAEEPPESGEYAPYDLAMAKTAEPNTTGSQFFVVTGDPTPLTGGGYSLFGAVSSGQDVVDLIGSVATYGPQDDTPTQQIDILGIEITES